MTEKEDAALGDSEPYTVSKISMSDTQKLKDEVNKLSKKLKEIESRCLQCGAVMEEKERYFLCMKCGNTKMKETYKGEI